MSKRYVAIWFRHLTTDWYTRRRPELKEVPFVLAAPEKGRMVIRAANALAEAQGVLPDMVVADARAILPSLQVFDDPPGQAEKLLNGLAEWCIRFTPEACPDLPDGLLLDASGCTHLWGGEHAYLKDIGKKMRGFGYDVRAAIADTAGTAWAISRYGRQTPFIPPGGQMEALLSLPAAALRLDNNILERLDKLGLYQVGSFIHMPRSALRRRFGSGLLQRIDQALGTAPEALQPVKPLQPYQERLPSLEPIRTATAIGIALNQLLDALCKRLQEEEKGLRTATFKAYRVDGNIQQIPISTGRPSANTAHLFRLFELKIATIEPALGFELFVLEAGIVEDHPAVLEQLWQMGKTEHEKDIAELMDRLAGKVGINALHRYLPVAHYWPERSIKQAGSLQEKPQTPWKTDRPRPVHLLPEPELIEVMAPIPDYPPVLFHYKGQLFRIEKADGPERIEREWWLEDGEHRDYYCVEDQAGARYWIFRLGHYANNNPRWFIHGFFA